MLTTFDFRSRVSMPQRNTTDRQYCNFQMELTQIYKSNAVVARKHRARRSTTRLSLGNGNVSTIAIFYSLGLEASAAAEATTTTSVARAAATAPAT